MLQEIWTRNYEQFLAVVEATDAEIEFLDKISKYWISDVSNECPARCPYCGDIATMELEILTPDETGDDFYLNLSWDGNYCDHFEQVDFDGEYSWCEHSDKENEMTIQDVQKIFFDICPSCSDEIIDEGHSLQTSTFDGYCCGICGRLDFNGNSEYEREWRRIEVPVKLDYEEPCNCGDRITHNNGGNYHTTYWTVAE